MLSVFALLIFAATQPLEDKKPDFSGVWSVVIPSGIAQKGQLQQDQQTRRFSRVPASLGSGWGKQFTIVQSEDGLTVERVFFARGDMQPALKYRYSFDGTETKNTIMMGRGIQEQVSTAAWDGEKLVIKTLYTSQNPVDGQKVKCEVTQILSLLIDTFLPDSTPSLVMETTRSGVLGGPPSMTRTVYKKD